MRPAERLIQSEGGCGCAPRSGLLQIHVWAGRVLGDGRDGYPGWLGKVSFVVSCRVVSCRVALPPLLLVWLVSEVHVSGHGPDQSMQNYEIYIFVTGSRV